MKFYTFLIDDFDLVSADSLQKMPGAYPLKLWVKDRIGARHDPYSGTVRLVLMEAAHLEVGSQEKK